MSNIKLRDWVRYGLTTNNSSSSSSGMTADFGFETYLRPFSAQSPWNMRVEGPVFDTYEIPTDTYNPAVQASIYSAEFVLARWDDPSLTFYPTLNTPVRGLDGTTPAINTAYGTSSNLYSFTVPRMPASFNVAAGTDGHIDVLDPVTGIIHSFWQAKRGSVASIAVTNGGSGYTPNSTTIPVTITGDGTGATARGTTNSSGVLTSITVTLTGANYTYANIVVGGTGAGATATATVDTLWRCYQYNWCHISDTGWGDRGRYYKGARAAAVPTCAGLIRRHEVDDDDYMFRHALAMSMTYSGLSATTPFIFPATAADATYNLNRGNIPEGALMMLPKTFSPDSLTNTFLRKICRTLQTYGAYVVDRNTGTPFVFYVEGVDNWFNVKEYSPDRTYDSNGVAQSNSIFAELQTIRAALRQVIGVQYYVDGYGNKLSALPDRVRMSNGVSGGSFTQSPAANPPTVLAMTSRYDSVTDEVVIGGIAGAWTMTHTNPPNNTNNPTFSRPLLKPSTRYKLEAVFNPANPATMTIKPSVNVTGGGPRLGQPTLSPTNPVGYFTTGDTISSQSMSYTYAGTGTGEFRFKLSLIEVTNEEVGTYYPMWVTQPTIASAMVGVACTPTKNVSGNASGSFTYTYQWWLSTGVGVAFTNISSGLGGTSETYTPQASDAGKLLCRTAILTAPDGTMAGATTNTVTVGP